MSVSVIVDPVHTVPGPLIVPATGVVLTVIFVVVVAVPHKALPSVNVIIVEPALIPPTIPVVEPIVPIPVEPLLHVPPVPVAVTSVNVMVEPVHTTAGPVMAPAFADAFTVTITVVATETVVAIAAGHAFASVYDIVVVPALTPPTTPVVEPTVPFAVLVLLHVPPGPTPVLSLNVIDVPVHTVSGVPLIVPAVGGIAHIYT